MSDIDPITGRRTATDRRQHFRMATGSFTAPGKLVAITDPVERMVTKGLHAAAIDWCREYGTDGHVRLEDLCAQVDLPLEFGKNLIVFDLCHQADHGCPRCPQPRIGHVYLHDYLEHNRSAAQEAQTHQRRVAGGNAASAARWQGHIPQVREKRPPGRPRKNPRPVPVSATGQALEISSNPVVEGEIVLEHPAEMRARETGGKKRGRPRRAAPAAFSPTVIELCELLASRVRENGYTVAKNLSINTWYTPCRLLLERGVPNADPPAPLTPEQIRKAIMWATDDAFWLKNIRSMEKLREQYERLRDDAKDTTRPRRGQGGQVRRLPAAPARLPMGGMAAILAGQLGSEGMVKGG